MGTLIISLSVVASFFCAENNTNEKRQNSHKRGEDLAKQNLLRTRYQNKYIITRRTPMEKMQKKEYFKTLDRRSFLKVAGITAGGAIIGGTLPLFSISNSKAKTGGELKAAIVGVAKIDTFDPALIIDIANWQIAWGIYNSLVKFDGEMNIISDLAKSWEIHDPTAYIFHLKRGILFHDGNECTAEDVKFSLERIMDPSTGAIAASKFSEIKEILPQDKYTVVIKTKKPFAPLLFYLANTRTASQIVSKKAIQKYGKDFGAHPVGTGPFKFAEWKPGAYVTLEKFKSYINKGLPYLDKIIFPLIPEEVSGTSALIAGDVHAINVVSPSMAKQLEKEKNTKLYTKPGLNFRFIMLNLKQKPFEDMFLRQAFAHAINRKELIDVVYSGDAVESIGPIPPALKWVYDPTLLEQTFNPEKARALLRKSKYSKREINDMAIYLEGYGTGWWKRFAEVASYQISQVLGIEIKPRISEYGAVVERVKVGSYSMCVSGLLGPVEVDEYLYDNYHTMGSLNQRFNRNYSNKEVDRLLDKGREIINLEERANYYKKAQKTIVEEAPDIFCFHANISQAFRENIKGFVQTAYNGYGAQLEEVWIE